MAITKPVWSLEQTGYNSTINAAAIGDTDIDLSTNGWDMVVGLINIDLATASSVNIRIFRSTDGGTTFTDESLAGGFSVDSNGSYPIDVVAEDFVRISILNNDGASPTGTIKVTYQGRQWETN